MAVINAFAQDAVDRAEPLTVAAAYAQCRDAALAESVIGAIGLEIESHLVDLDHVADPVPWERVEAIAAAVGRVAPSTAVTVEPGGQIELSGPPDAGVGPAVARLRYESTGARLALAECRLGLAHAWADPVRPSLRVNPRPRYRAMEQHFAATGWGPGRAGHDELDRRLAGQSPGRPHGRVVDRPGSRAYRLGPTLVAIAASSAWLHGPDTGWKSVRQRALERARRAHLRPGAGLRSEERPRRGARSRLSLGQVRDARPRAHSCAVATTFWRWLLSPVLAVVASGGGPAPHAVAYVIRRVEHALAGQRLVFIGHTTSAMGPSITWAYGPRHRWVEFTGSGCGHTLPNGECTHRGSSEPYLAQGTALIGGKLTGVYVTFFDRKWSRLPAPAPASACSVTGALEMGGPPVPANRWANFINATLACGAAHVDGHAWIDGVKTTKITGSQVAVKLSPGYGKTVRQKRARVRWALYVNPKTYLPVRIYGSTQTFGGPAGGTLSSSVTDVQWLPPTAANIAQALVTIPAGFHHVNSPASQ